jgi:hypothetical protein
MLIIVTYDLRDKDRDYAALYRAIKRQGRWWHHISSTWLISTKKTPEDVWEAIEAHVSEDDNVLVTRLSGDYSGWLPQRAWTWIAKHITD